MKTKIVTFALLMAGLLSFASCSDDESTSQVNYTLTPPELLEGYTISSGNFTFTNVSTGVETKAAYSPHMAVTVPDGLYNVYFIGEALYTPTLPEETPASRAEQTVTQKVQGSKQNVEVKGGICDLTLELYVVNGESTDFVIAEIFGTMSYYPNSDKQYRGDQYVRIYNNTSKTLYADGLVFLESKFNATATSKHDYTPNMNNEALTVSAVAMIPGSGQEHPVAPGESIILCDNAIDHTQTNSNSINLSKADFEWFTTGTTSNPDIDNPEVPNLDMVYNSTKTIWILSGQGNRSYAIGRIPKEIGTEKYLTDYTYDYTYTMADGTTSKVFKGNYYFPNEWIIDGINLSPKNAYAWSVLAPAVDMGYTYYGVNATLTETTGKAVVRKVARTDDDGRVILQDTNNSSVDFTSAASPTLKK